MSNWEREQGSGSSYPQSFGNYYSTQNRAESQQYYGNFYTNQQPVYEPLLNGTSEVYRNGYQSGHQPNSSSAEEFFRMFQEQQQRQQMFQSQQPEQQHYSHNGEYDSTSENFQIPTMVFPSTNQTTGDYSLATLIMPIRV